MNIKKSIFIQVLCFLCLLSLSITVAAVESYDNAVVAAPGQAQKYTASEIPIEWIYPDYYDAVEPNTDTATSGYCGLSLTWELQENGTLIITGTGAMTDFARVRSPWYANRSKITAVSFPDGITSIGNYAFYDCDNLTSIEIPDSVSVLGMGSFSDCDALSNILLGKSLKTIGNSAFYFSDALTNITIPDNLQTIGTYAFGDSIQYVCIPDSVTYIPEEILSLSSICAFTSQNNTQIGYYTDEYNILFYGRKDGTAQIVKCPRNDVEKYIVPDNVTEIGAYAFTDRYICEISFPDGLCSIGNHAFDGNSLTHVTLNPSLTVVGKCAFQNNPLETLTLPDCLTSIGVEAFQPKRILIPDTVTYVAPSIAQITGTEAYIVYDTDGSGYFDEDCVLYYTDPDTGEISLVAFPPAREIPDYSVLPGTKVIAESAFYGNAALTAIHVPATVEEIRTNAEGCNALQSIYFAGNAPDIHGSLVNAILYYNIGRSGWATPYWTDADNMQHQTAVLLPDLNSDGMFDYYDITKLYSCFRGKTSLPEDSYTDFDGDGTFGYYDITRLYGIYRDGGVAGNGDNGFDVEPKITTIGTIEFKSNVSGTLYYYYAKTDEQPSPDKFLSNWRSAREYGNVDVIRNRTATMSYKTSLAEMYPYLVFCIKDGYIYHTPYILDIGSSSGFIIKPYCDAEAEKVYFKTSSDGYISYYFSRSSSTSGLTEDFDTMYNYTANEYKGTFSVKGGQLDYIDFSTIDTSRYSYIVMMFTDKNDNDYLPTYLDLTKDSQPDSTYGITVYSISNGILRFAVDTSGTLHYKQVSSDGASTGYFSSTRTVTKDRIEEISFDIDDGRYMAMWLDNLPVMYIDLSDDYSRGDDDGSNTRGTGFRDYTLALQPNGTLDVTFIPDVDGTVYFSSSVSGTTGQPMSVTAGSQYSVSLDVSKLLAFGDSAQIGSITITMQLTSGSKVYERVTLLDTSR